MKLIRACVITGGAALAVLALAQTPLIVGTPEISTVTLTNDAVTRVLSNTVAGTVPVAVSITCVSGGPIRVLNLSTNLHAGGYWLTAGQSVTLDQELRCIDPWYVQRQASTNTTVTAVRQFKKP